jgi:hypothetical protein
MPEEILQEENPIYKFMKSNNLTDLNEGEFLTKYSAPNKAKEIHSFMVSNKLTDLDESKFYDSYLKKKDQGVLPSVSSPTRSLSPDFEKGKAFAEKGFLMKPEGTKEQKIATEEGDKQGLLLNLVSSLDKGFAKNFISSPIKGLGTVLQGATKKVLGGTGQGYISDELIKYGDYLNNAIDELTPQDEEFKNTLWDQAAQAVGQIGSLVLTGGLTGAAGKGAALVSQAPKGAALTAVKTLGSQLSSPTAVSAGLSMGQAEFDRAIQGGATDDQAFEAFYKNAVTGSVLETIPVMQFFKRFNKSTAGSVANYIKTKGVAGLTGGIEEMTTEVMQQIYANKTAKDIYNINQDILDGVGSSGGIGFGIGFLLNAMGANAKILRKQGKVQEADVLENQVKQYEDNLENPKVTSGNKVSAKDIVTQGPEIGTQKAVQNLDRDLANNVITPEQYQEGIIFAEKAAQVADKIPETVIGESRAKSIELLVERNDIKQANDNLIQQKQTTDEAYHAGIDEEIKANEEKIKKVDAEVYNIAKKPSKEFGTKKYEVDGEEVTKEAFEALQGKPLGTKTIIEPTQIGGLKVIKRAPDAPNGEAVYEVEGERFLTADGKELGVAKVKTPTQEIKPEVKIEDVTSKQKDEKFNTPVLKTKESNFEKLYIPRNVVEEAYKNDKDNNPIFGNGNQSLGRIIERGGYAISELNTLLPNWKDLATKEVKIAEVKQPTKELVEGESVEFKTPEGNSIVGEKVIIPGFEKMDMVIVKEGLNNIVYDLASGMPISEGDFTKEGTIKSIKDNFEARNITQAKLYGLIYKGNNTSSFENKNRVRQINPSSMFESYSEKRKASDKAEYEKLPLKYTPKEIEGLNKLRDKAKENGLDTIAAEIEEKAKERFKEGSYKPPYDFFDKQIKSEIERKTKEEAKNNKVPYPKEFIKTFPNVTEDYLKKMVNSGYKVDKFEKIPADVKKVMIDGLQLSRDFMNKYGYHPYEQSDNFFTKLLYFMNSTGARENRESKIIESKKELISALDDLKKVHEKEFGKKAEAEVKPKAKEEIEEPEVLAKDELKKAEAKFIAAEDKLKKARNKIEATQVKQAGIFGGEQKGMFAMGGEEAKNTLEPLRKATKEAKAELDNVRNKIKVQEQAQPELKPIKKEAPKKTYQEAVKEKIEAEKKLTKKIAGEKAAVTKEIYRKVNMMDEPRDAEEAALRYLAGGGKIRDEDINDAYGRVKRAELNTGRRELKTDEVKSKDFGGGKEKISDIAHRIWEDSGQEISEKEAEEALMAEIGNNNTRLEAAEAYLEKYSPEYLEEKTYQRQAEESEAQILEAEQKVAETNEKIKEEFKEVVGKASKKAKENAKIEFVDRNFEYLKQKIKIEEKCPF